MSGQRHSQDVYKVIDLAKRIAICRPWEWLSSDERSKFSELKLARQKQRSELVPFELKKTYIVDAVERSRYPQNELYHTALQELKPTLRGLALESSRVKPDSAVIAAAKRAAFEKMDQLLVQLDLEDSNRERGYEITAEPLPVFIRSGADAAISAQKKQVWKRELATTLEERWPDCPKERHKQLTELPIRNSEFDLRLLARSLVTTLDAPTIYDAFVDREILRFHAEQSREPSDARLRGIFDDDIRQQWIELEQYWKHNIALIRKYIRNSIGQSEFGIGDVENETLFKLYRLLRARDQLFLGPLEIAAKFKYICYIAMSVINSWYSTVGETSLTTTEAERTLILTAQNQDMEEEESRQKEQVYQILYRCVIQRRAEARRILAANRSEVSAQLSKSATATTCIRILDLTEVAIRVWVDWCESADNHEKAILLVTPTDESALQKRENRTYMKLVRDAKCEIDAEWAKLYRARMPRSNSKEPGTTRVGGKRVMEGTDDMELRRDALGKNLGRNNSGWDGKPITARTIVDDGVMGLMRTLILAGLIASIAEEMERCGGGIIG